MPEPIVAPEAIPGDATGILADDFAEAEAELAATGPEVEGEQAPENAPAPEGEKEAGTETPAESEPKGDEGEEEEESDETPDPKKKPDETEPPEDPEKPKPIKLGNREFATTEDALAEAERLVGHNANLAGQVNEAARRIVRYEKEIVPDLQTKLKEAYAVNQQWQEWHEAQQNGEAGDAPKAGVPAEAVEGIVERKLAEERTKQETEQVIASMKQELEVIEKLPNYAQAYDLMFQIADKSNPLTGKNFTPKEAYAFACKQLGIENQLEKKPVPPKPAVNPAAKNAAARPTPTAGSAKPKAQPKVEIDEADEELAKAFPLH